MHKTNNLAVVCVWQRTLIFLVRSVHCVSVCNGVTASERRTRTQFMLRYFSCCVRCAVLLYGPHKLDAWRGVLLLRPQKPHRRVCDVCFVVCGEQAPMPNYHTTHYIHYTSRPAAASTTQRITIRAAHIYRHRDPCCPVYCARAVDVALRVCYAREIVRGSCALLLCYF